MQPSADLRDIYREDFGASIALVFGKPSLFNRDVPTITNVWGNEAHGQGSVLPMLRRPEVSKAFILQSGAAEADGWVTETRDIRAHYRRAFGEELRDRIGVVAIFTDND